MNHRNSDQCFLCVFSVYGPQNLWRVSRVAEHAEGTLEQIIGSNSTGGSRKIFTGTIDKVTIDLKKMNSADEDAAKKAAAISDEDDADTPRS